MFIGILGGDSSETKQSWGECQTLYFYVNLVFGIWGMSLSEKQSTVAQPLKQRKERLQLFV